MRLLVAALLVLIITSICYGKIYKWVDDNGTVHFSDKPVSGQAKEINVRGTGITVHNAATLAPRSSAQPKTTTGKHDEKSIEAESHQETSKTPKITEADYRITANVGELAGDAISISGRISSGPRCDNLVVTATAVNENGMTATIEDHVSKPNSFGSTLFEGATRVTGPDEDYGFWEIAAIRIACHD